MDINQNPTLVNHHIGTTRAFFHIFTGNYIIADKSPDFTHAERAGEEFRSVVFKKTVRVFYRFTPITNRIWNAPIMEKNIPSV